MTKDDLLRASVGSLYARFCTASVIGMIGISVYILADTFFIANGIGQNALAALNIALPAYSVVSAVGMLLGIGCATCYSLEVGRGDAHAAGGYFRVAFWFALAMGAVFMILGVWAPEPVSRLLGATPETLPECASYLRTILFFAPAFMLNQVYLAFVRNMDRPNVAMVSMLAGSIFNVVMDYVAIYVWNMGMAGAALATAFSPMTGLLISAPVVHRNGSGVSVGTVPGDAVRISRILAGGLSSFIVELSMGIAIFIMNALMLGLEGNIGVASYGIVANVAYVAYAVFTGLGQALQPIVSVNYGAGLRLRVRHSFVIGVIVSIATGVAMWALGAGFAGPIAAVFNGENDPALQQLTVRGMELYFLGFIPMGANVLISYFFQAVLDVRDSVVISLLRGVILISALAVLLACLVGTDGVWTATVVTEAATLAYGLLAFRKWTKEHKPSHADAAAGPAS